MSWTVMKYIQYKCKCDFTCPKKKKKNPWKHVETVKFIWTWIFSINSKMSFYILTELIMNFMILFATAFSETWIDHLVINCLVHQAQDVNHSSYKKKYTPDVPECIRTLTENPEGWYHLWYIKCYRSLNPGHIICI